MFTIEEILEFTGARLVKGDANSRISGVSVDSRTIKPNELFVAIRGRRFDGHSFIPQARRRGAGAILFSQALKRSSSIPLIGVKNTIRALGALAYYYRMRFKIPVVAITGSNGKTTTKEMLASILGRRFNVLCNPETQNNQIGVPLAILNLRQRHNLAVIEIGANHRGEIDRLSWIIKPTVGIITNIGPSHLEFFKTLKGVFEAKLELIRNLAKNGKLVINKDDRFLSQLNSTNLRTVTFGFNQSCNFYGQIIKRTEKETIFSLNRRHRIVLKTLGRHNVYNALASIAVARSFGISYNEIKKALALFEALPMRMQMLDIDNIKIINDCYNSNPGSLGCALDFLRDCSSIGKYKYDTTSKTALGHCRRQFSRNQRKKVVVCGDMMELGREAEKLHSNIGKRIAKGKIDFLITVGPLSRNVACGAYSAGMSQNSIRAFRNTAGAAEFLRGLIGPGDIVLIKGSRAMQMENIVECFTNSSIR